MRGKIRFFEADNVKRLTEKRNEGGRSYVTPCIARHYATQKNSDFS